MTGQTKREAEEKELIQLKNPPWQARAIHVCQVPGAVRPALTVDSQYILRN